MNNARKSSYETEESSMKFGVSSYSFSKYMNQTGADYYTVCDLAKKMGYDAIEFIDLSLDVQQADSLIDLAKDIRRHCAEIGLPIAAYTVGADFMRPNEADAVKEKVDVAAALGAKVLRHDASWSLPEGMDWRQLIDRIAPDIRRVTQYAEDKGIRTCTENHGYVLQDAERVETLIRTVNHPNYGWLVDMGNFLCADDQPVHAVPIAAPYAFHVHVKDFLYKPAWAENPGQGWFPSRNGSFLRGTVAGHGVVPIRQCLSTLKKAGYAGVVSYEFEGMEENLPALEAAIAFLRGLNL